MDTRMSFSLPETGCEAADSCAAAGWGVFVGIAVAVAEGVSVGRGVGVAVAGGKGVGEGVVFGVAVGMTASVAAGRGVSVDFNSPTGSQDRMELSCEEAGLLWVAAEAEEPIPGRKNHTAIRHNASTNNRIGMKIRRPGIAFLAG